VDETLFVQKVKEDLHAHHVSKTEIRLSV
jgi:hypothetical protein